MMVNTLLISFFAFISAWWLALFGIGCVVGFRTKVGDVWGAFVAAFGIGVTAGISTFIARITA